MSRPAPHPGPWSLHGGGALFPPHEALGQLTESEKARLRAKQLDVVCTVILANRRAVPGATIVEQLVQDGHMAECDPHSIGCGRHKAMVARIAQELYEAGRLAPLDAPPQEAAS